MSKTSNHNQNYIERALRSMSRCVAITIFAMLLSPTVAMCAPDSSHLFDAKQLSSESALSAIHELMNGEVATAATMFENIYQADQTSPDAPTLLAAAALTWMEAHRPARALTAFGTLSMVRCTTPKCRYAIDMLARYAVGNALSAFNTREAARLCTDLVNRGFVRNECVDLLVDDRFAFSRALSVQLNARGAPRDTTLAFAQAMVRHAGRGDATPILRTLAQTNDAVGLHAAYTLTGIQGTLSSYRRCLTIALSGALTFDSTISRERLQQEATACALYVADETAMNMVQAYVARAQRVASQLSTSAFQDYLDASTPRELANVASAFTDAKRFPSGSALVDMHHAKVLFALSRELGRFALRCPSTGAPGNLLTNCTTRYMVVSGSASRVAEDYCAGAIVSFGHGRNDLAIPSPNLMLSCRLDALIFNDVLASAYIVREEMNPWLPTL